MKTKKNGFKLDFLCKPLIESMINVAYTSKPKKHNSFSPNYIRNRSSLIDWMFEMSRKLELSLNSAHLAVVYLDIIMANDPEDSIPIHLYSTTCLLLAGFLH